MRDLSLKQPALCQHPIDSERALFVLRTAVWSFSDYVWSLPLGCATQDRSRWWADGIHRLERLIHF